MQADVVTAVHASHAAFLPATWRSLVDQSHTRWRWLVQIDGPADEAWAVLKSCGAMDDPRVSVASHGTSEGPAVTRNIALGRTSAPLVQNVDADDELEPGALAALATALSDHPDAGYAVGRARDLMGDGLLIDHPLPVLPGILPRGALLPAWRTTPTDYRVPVHPAGVMWRRPLLLALGGWSALQGMEDTGVLMAASAVAEGVLVDAATLRYRRHAAQMSKQASKFAGGGGEQIALIRQRAAVLRSLPSWSHAPEPP
ncbi:glycosyltransferase family 2 protein [Streptomyces sp. NBC_00727]|uniref:glycosyltransferase family 2 protein n=1 Tax=Streptomyces sp. NBC_00727 TaxID=2903675 RepID=UPI00386BCD97